MAAIAEEVGVDLTLEGDADIPAMHVLRRMVNARNALVASGGHEESPLGDTCGCDRRPNGAHQPPASCAQSRRRPSATTSPLHRWPDVPTGKCTSPRDPTQAPDPSDRGAVGGRLHALVGPLPELARPPF